MSSVVDSIGNAIGGDVGKGLSSAINSGLDTVTAGTWGLANGKGYFGETLESAQEVGMLAPNVDLGAGDVGPVQQTSAATYGQAQDQYGNVQTGLAQQQAFLKAIQAQNGLTNQSDVYNQLSGVAAGTGPNPAQAMLANSTGANVANQAALMAGQRGAGANVGLMARQAGQQGANIQQQAAGQGAALQAQQSLEALRGMGNLATNQVQNEATATQGYNQAAQGAQQNILNAISSSNATNAGIANTNATNRARLEEAENARKGNMLGNIMNTAGTVMGMMGTGGAAAASGGGGFMSAGGAADTVGYNPSTMLAAEGGQVPQQYAEGSKGFIQTITDAFTEDDKPKDRNKDRNKFATPEQAEAMKRIFGDTTKKAEGGAVESNSGPKSNVGRMFMQQPTAVPYMAKGGEVPALVSPGETYLDREDVSKVKQGANPLAVGEKIPGKPKVKGNSYENDTVPKNLEAGGVVIPNSIMQSKDAAKKASEFVAAILRKQSLSKGK